ncbi:MAG: Unknown protein [uncultured Sulfurovum sp.]|uniref:Uncharacterized protein n=1 Tax=uncultured Sulfurovum sp. TaxID=269237 RepID=A0A6S6SID9_9BACT|nr:MAG: Unknown protein [uncultured Sulfurovum sp.]
MKTLKMIVVSTLLSSILAFGNTARVTEPTKHVYKVLEGNSMNIQGKPGLAVELSYKSAHVEVGELSDVNITLMTDLDSGTLKVNLKPLEANSIGLEAQNLEFELSKSMNYFPINLQVNTIREGIHYINVTLSLEGEGLRVLAVPVNVGTISNALTNKTVETTDTGVNISVSSAQEEIK